jgi:hypothetical protein
MGSDTPDYLLSVSNNPRLNPFIFHIRRPCLGAKLVNASFIMLYEDTGLSEVFLLRPCSHNEESA